MFGITLCAMLAGCGLGSTATAMTTAATSGNATINFVVTDTPPSNVTAFSSATDQERIFAETVSPRPSFRK